MLTSKSVILIFNTEHCLNFDSMLETEYPLHGADLVTYMLLRSGWLASRLPACQSCDPEKEITDMRGLRAEKYGKLKQARNRPAWETHGSSELPGVKSI